MHPLFGLKTHPGYCEIDVKPLISSAGFAYPNRVTLNDTLYGPEVIRETVHETCHFLHPHARRLALTGAEVKEEDVLLVEIVANLGRLIYFSETKGREWVDEHLLVGILTYAESLAKDIFEADPGMLAKIADLDFTEASRLITPVLKRPLDSRMDPYS
jgi:hypothetical protein